ARPPSFHDHRSEPELDDIRLDDRMDDTESFGLEPRPSLSRRPAAAAPFSVGKLVAGMVGGIGILWGGYQGVDMVQTHIHNRVDELLAAERQTLNDSLTQLAEERRALATAKSTLENNMSKADTQVKALLEERKKLKEEKQKLEEELKKQSEARKKADEAKTQLEEKEKQAKEKRQAEESRRQQEEAKRDEEAKVVATERTRLKEEQKHLEQEKKQLEQEKKQWEESRKAREEKVKEEKTKAEAVPTTPTIEGVDKDLSAGRLSEPKGNNAMEKMEWLARLDPNNKVLAPRWQKLAEMLLAKADEAIAAKDFKGADLHLKQAEKISFAREQTARARQRLAHAKEANSKLDLDALRQAEEEEVLRRLEQNRSPANRPPQPRR
ncbi:MAG: hypothetical protein G8345_16075, partial [Magnetococcales bacterium]|nr:hypothetical protein [Magnetococcales bacterium]